jgi:hypothetical protein
MSPLHPGDLIGPEYLPEAWPRTFHPLPDGLEHLVSGEVGEEMRLRLDSNARLG